MAENTSVLVEILQGTQAVSSGCNCSSCGSAASCGSNIDYEKATSELADQLKKTYGDQVEVKYVNVDKTGLDDYAVVSRVLQMGYPYPITLINGEPKFAGGIMEREIKSNIDELLKPTN